MRCVRNNKIGYYCNSAHYLETSHEHFLRKIISSDDEKLLVCLINLIFCIQKIVITTPDCQLDMTYC